jgi:hypothetical protein
MYKLLAAAAMAARFGDGQVPALTISIENNRRDMADWHL